MMSIATTTIGTATTMTAAILSILCGISIHVDLRISRRQLSVSQHILNHVVLLGLVVLCHVVLRVA